MLHEFLTLNRDEIIARARAKVAARPAPRPTEEELNNGVPLFLSQLGETLRLSTGGDEMARSAAAHGGDLLRMGFTVSQVVHDYGDVCQAITELADEVGAPITTEEFRTLNRCLDDAIAEAVTEYTRQREQSIAEQDTERLGVLAHEARNQIFAALMAFEVLKTGNVGVRGSTGSVLGRSLIGLRDLMTRALAEVRLEAPNRRRERVSLAEIVEEIELDASVEANARDITLRVTPAPRGVDVEVDRQILLSAVANLLQNAFKFTPPGGHVSLTTSTTPDRVLMDVEDECGGLPPGDVEGLFRPFEQRSAKRKGLGLGLHICRKSVEASGGVIRVRDLPGKGCIFTVDLPRMPPP